jgi:hypothetical protein
MCPALNKNNLIDRFLDCRIIECEFSFNKICVQKFPV